MKTASSAIIFFLILILNSAVYSAKLPRYGKISDDELQMTSFPEDPEADAVFLFDSGDVRIVAENRRYKMIYTRHTRIKIMSEAGKKYANVEIPYWHEDGVIEVKAICVQPNGKKSKLKKSQVHEKTGEFFKTKVFAVPGVTVGSVVEYRYKIKSDYVHSLRPWFFQNSEHTIHSQYTAVIPPGFSFNIRTQNMSYSDPVKTRVMQSDGNSIEQLMWRQMDMPGIPEEPFMRAVSDYRAALFFELMFFKSPSNYVEFTSSWSDIVQGYKDKEADFKNSDNFIYGLVHDRIRNHWSDIDKAEILYKFVSEEIATKGRGWIFTRRAPQEVAEGTVGSGIEKNALLISLLKRVGIECYPLLISTRDHGLIWKGMAQRSQLNYVLVYFKIDGKTYVVDTESQYCPMGILPKDKLVETGLLVDDGEGEFITLEQPTSINMKYCSSVAQIDDQGTLSVVSTLRYEGYHGVNARASIAESSEESFAEAALTKLSNVAEIDSFKVEGLDNIKESLRLVLYYDVVDFAQVAGDMMYVTSPILSKLESNPLLSKKRHFPVEFPIRVSQTEEITIALPDGYDLVETPKPIIMRFSGLTYVLTSELVDGAIFQQRQLMRTRLKFPMDMYEELRAFYGDVVTADQAVFVLQRNNE